MLQVALKDLTLLSPLAGAFWAPQQPPVYNPELPVWPGSFSDDEKEAQRHAATAQVAALHDAIKAGKSSFTFPAGVYRLSDVIVIERTHNFTLSMPDVELITQLGGHFKLLNNTNLVIRGPLTLDADPVGVSQTIVQSSDKQNKIEVLLMPGYPAPTNKSRVMVFDNQGGRLPTGQINPDTVTSLGEGRFRLEFNAANFALAGLGTVAQAGNYMAHEGSAGGVALWSNRGVTFEQVTAYGGGGVWGLWETGLTKFVQWRSLRRPGTNRLYSGGGAFQACSSDPLKAGPLQPAPARLFTCCALGGASLVRQRIPPCASANTSGPPAETACGLSCADEVLPLLVVCETHLSFRS